MSHVPDAADQARSGARTSADAMKVDLSPSRWPAGDYEAYMNEQASIRTQACVARGRQGAVSVSYNAFAARAGLEALKQGGNAIDAAMTTALAQVALSAGAPISYFGIMSLVYYEAKTGEIHTMNAEWNTVLGETDPLTIPGGIDFHNGIKGKDPSGRTALVGGFMKGVESAHKRFGKLPFARLFDPSIELAERGFIVNRKLASFFAFRPNDMQRLPETRATFFKPDGASYQEGDLFRQPRLAETLRAVASNGAGHMYGGVWGERLVAAVQAEGGKMTLDDLTRYEVAWSAPLVAPIGNGYTVQTSPWPNAGGVGLIEAQNLAEASGLALGPHWTMSAAALRKAIDISQQFITPSIPQAVLGQIFPGIDFSPDSRVTREHASKLWALMAQGATPARFKQTTPMHSDDVVAVDAEGNIAAITHSINCVCWGKTAIVIDGVSIADAGSFQQQTIANTEPGGRLSSPTETGILFKNGKPVLGFASMNAGLHHRTFQCLLNYVRFGMSLEDSVNTADFFNSDVDPVTGEMAVSVPGGRFDHTLLDAIGYAWREALPETVQFAGQGDWIAVARDPESGVIEAVSHNRGNSCAVAC
jgi:gamma-glutamyltranspeptidase/glutathione hydrolase